MSYVLRDAFESSLEMYLPSVLQRIFVIQACNDALSTLKTSWNFASSYLTIDNDEDHSVYEARRMDASAFTGGQNRLRRPLYDPSDGHMVLLIF